LILILLPLVVAGAWARREQALTSPLGLYVLIAITFSALWFFFGASQRVRMFLPVYPLVLIVTLAATERVLLTHAFLAWPFRGAIAAVAAIQFSGVFLFASVFITYLTRNEDRDTFLTRTVSRYDAVIWARDHLPPGAIILTLYRELVYLTTPPAFAVHPWTQALIEIRVDSRDPKRFWSQIQSQGISHMIIPMPESPEIAPPGLGYLIARLIADDCAALLAQIATRAISSRTLGGFAAAGIEPTAIIALKPDTCRYARGGASSGISG
jgi:hypothetical protein